MFAFFQFRHTLTSRGLFFGTVGLINGRQLVNRLRAVQVVVGRVSAIVRFTAVLPVSSVSRTNCLFKGRPRHPISGLRLVNYRFYCRTT